MLFTNLKTSFDIVHLISQQEKIIIESIHYMADVIFYFKNLPQTYTDFFSLMIPQRKFELSLYSYRFLTKVSL